MIGWSRKRRAPRKALADRVCDRTHPAGIVSCISTHDSFKDSSKASDLDELARPFIVDLVPLEDARPSVRARVLQRGEPLYDRDQT
jgi:hypothetical protein